MKLLTAAFFLWALPLTLLAEVPTQEQLEAKFIAMLTNAKLQGTNSSLADGQLGQAKNDTYVIARVAKVSGDQWQVFTVVEKDGQRREMPIPVTVKWAGDAAVLILDKLQMGGGKAYSARVMFYENTYAGQWSGEGYGGMISGIILPAQP